MITTCPACRTAFRVTQGQLAAREGSVRCGRCATVFDAREALQPAPLESAPKTRDRRDDGITQTEAATVPEPEQAPPAPSGAAVTENALPNRARAAPAPARPKEQPRASKPRDADLVFSAAEPERAPPRAGWIAGSILLALGLMAQIAFHYRSEIALLFPEIRPALMELCASLACEVSLPRHAEQISIESSDLQADPGNPGVMVLTATLRNRAAFAQSHPSLELTLTDSQDQPLARRVLGVKDYLGRNTGGEMGFPANSELPVKVYMEASSLKATGYRLYLFFP